MDNDRKCRHYKKDDPVCQGCPGSLPKDDDPKDWCPYCNGDGIVCIPVNDSGSLDWRIVGICPIHGQKFKREADDYIRDHKGIEAQKARAVRKLGRWHIVFDDDWLATATEHGWFHCKVKWWHKWLKELVTND